MAATGATYRTAARPAEHLVLDLVASAAGRTGKNHCSVSACVAPAELIADLPRVVDPALYPSHPGTWRFAPASAGCAEGRFPPCCEFKQEIACVRRNNRDVMLS